MTGINKQEMEVSDSCGDEILLKMLYTCNLGINIFRRRMFLNQYEIYYRRLYQGKHSRHFSIYIQSFKGMSVMFSLQLNNCKENCSQTSLKHLDRVKIR